MFNIKYLKLDEYEDDEIIDYNELETINNNLVEKIEDENVIYYNDIEEEFEEEELYDIITDSEKIPEIKIEIISDNENNKFVKFTLEILIDNDERISVDLNISKKTYLLIAEELFK